MKIFKKITRESVIARSEIPRLSLRGWRSQPKQSHDRLGTGSAIPPPFSPPRGGRIKEGVIRLLRGACPEQNNEILRFTQNDKRRRARNDIASSESGFALIIVMFVLLMMTILGLNAIMTSSTDIKISGNERVSSKGLFIADAGLQHAIRVLRGQEFDTLLAGATAANNGFVNLDMDLSANVLNTISFDGGTYAITIRNNHMSSDAPPEPAANLNKYTDDTDGIVIIRASANYNNTTKTIEAEITRIASSFPIQAGMGIAGMLQGGAVLEMDISGNAFTISGGDAANNNPNDPLNPNASPPGSGWAATTGCSAKSGISVTDTAARTTILNTLTPQELNNINGSGGTGEGSVDTTPSLDKALIEGTVDKIIPYADRTINIAETTIMEGINWGTADNPQITVVNMTDPDNERELKIVGDSKGYGILIVNATNSTEGGELDLRGNFTWYGIIVVVGYAEAEIGAGGNIKIYGGLLMTNAAGGPGDDADNEIEIKGNTDIYYSCVAEQKAKNYSALTINSWHEVGS